MKWGGSDDKGLTFFGLKLPHFVRKIISQELSSLFGCEFSFRNIIKKL